MNPYALHLKNISMQFGSFKALQSINLQLAPGQRYALIGPNGAGKSTLVHILSGVYTPSQGHIYLATQCINRWPLYKRVQQGLGRSFQLTTLCLNLSPLEALMMAISERCHQAQVWWRPLASYTTIKDEAWQRLEQIGLAAQAHSLTAELAYGQQRLLEIALALALEPKVLILDEPAAGISAAESHALYEFIAQLPSTLSILFIEHDMDLVLQFAQRIGVLVEGQLIAEGEAHTIMAHPLVRAAYLGTGLEPS